jgi:hypothetical protein
MLIRATHLIPTNTFSYFLLIYLLLPQHIAISQLIRCRVPNSTVAAALLYWLLPDC